MNEDFTRDPERDAALSAALRGALGDVPEPDFGRLRASIAAQAELPLARRRRAARPGGFWRARSLVPLAAAAGVAGAALALTLRPQHAPLSEQDRQMVEQVVEASLSSAEVDPLLTGEAAREALLEAVVGS